MSDEPKEIVNLKTTNLRIDKLERRFKKLESPTPQKSRSRRGGKKKNWLVRFNDWRNSTCWDEIIVTNLINTTLTVIIVKWLLSGG